MGAVLVSRDPSDRSDLQYEVGFRLALVSRRFRARFAERMKSSSQTEARWSALYQLAREPRGLIQSELAERMGIQGPTLVRLLDALEAQGLVRRLSTPEDRRAKRVMIQPAGEEMVREVDIIAEKLRDDAFAGVTMEELLVTLRVLEKLGVTLDPAVSGTAHGETSKARLLPLSSQD
jgi:MarR family transcriptional regulator for hemolysin